MEDTLVASTMGVGRRMKKQGPPAPLDESKITSVKKRKAGNWDSNARGKKRKANGGIESQPPRKRPVNGTKNSALKGGTKGTFVNGQSKGNGRDRRISKPSLKKSSLPINESSDDDAPVLPRGDGSPEDGFMSGALLDSSEDETSPATPAPLDGAAKVDGDAEDDDAIESESTTSVYDSDTQNPTTMFSDGEGDSDAEEKLTAANIEGLSQNSPAPRPPKPPLHKPSSKKTLRPYRLTSPANSMLSTPAPPPPPQAPRPASHQTSSSSVPASPRPSASSPPLTFSPQPLILARTISPN